MGLRSTLIPSSTITAVSYLAALRSTVSHHSPGSELLRGCPQWTMRYAPLSPKFLLSLPPADDHVVRERGAAPAGRPAATAASPRHRRAGSSAGPRGADRPHGGEPPARFDDPVGSARLRQDNDRAAPSAWHRPRLRAALGGVLRRRRPAQGVRGGQETPRDRARHVAFRRRDPPLQPRPAGR